MRVWGLQFRNFWRDKRPSDYFERQSFRRGALVPRDALGLILAEHPHVAVLLDQDDLKLRFGGKLNPVISMRSLHELSLPLARWRAIPPGKIFLPIFALKIPFWTTSRCPRLGLHDSKLCAFSVHDTRPCLSGNHFCSHFSILNSSFDSIWS